MLLTNDSSTLTPDPAGEKLIVSNLGLSVIYPYARSLPPTEFVSTGQNKFFFN